MEKKLTFWQCIQHLARYISKNKVKLFIGLFFVVVANLTYAVMPMVEGSITSTLQQDLTAMHQNVPGAHIQMDVIVKILMTLASIYVVKVTSQFLSAFLITDSIQATMFDIRNAVERKINHLPISYFDKTKTGDLLSRITNDVETVSNALQQTLSRVIGVICTFVLVISMMLSINKTMTLIVVCGLPIIVGISFFIVKKSQPLFDKQQASLAALNASVNEIYSGYNEIIGYNQQEYAQNSFDKANEDMRKWGFRAQFASGSISPLTTFVTYIVIGITALYGCLNVITGVILLGDLQAFIRYIWNLNDSISQLSQLSSAVQSAFSGMNRLFTFLDLEEEKDHESIQKIEEVETIDFNHVSFSYTEDPLMKDVDFHVKKGQRIAIVGKTGAGKTTLTNLLLRFYDIQKGSIKINGIDIRDLSYYDLRDLFGLVLQDAWLFEGSVQDNLQYANHTARKDEIVEAAKKANVHHTIRTLSNGYDTLINESASNVSQGEKQLLTIARAILKNPKILILDEATSSVDTRLEKRLQDAMEEVMENRTSFVIAHRLSTIVSADMILVMDHGDIIETGSHEELLAKNGAYAKLYQSQFNEDE